MIYLYWVCYCIQFSCIAGDVLLQYQFLYRSIHSVLDTDNPCFYNGIQLLMVLSEISHSASYPLCSSVFHLLHYGIDVYFIHIVSS